MALDCLETLVGLSATTHDCFTGDAPAGYDTSDSGYYLTDQDFGLTVMDGSSLDGWTILSNARTQAIREFKSDLRALLRTRFDESARFRGVIGKLKFTASKEVGGAYIGHRYRFRRLRGMYLVLEKAWLGLNNSDNYTVTVKSNDPEFSEPPGLSISTTANQFTAAEWPSGGIYLPLWSDYVDTDYIEYYIAVQIDSARPLNNKLYCCGGPEWTGQFEASGFYADSASPETTGSFSSEGNGLAIKAHVECATLDWLCELTELNSYDLRDVAARCIQQRGAAIVAATLIETPTVGVGMGFDAPMLTDRRNFLNDRYSNNVKWISENVPIGVLSCFKCKDAKALKQHKILV